VDDDRGDVAGLPIALDADVPEAVRGEPRLEHVAFTG
jgi:hypothetical protein